MMFLLQVAGGVALILFGVRFLRRGLDRLFGPALQRWVRTMTDRSVRAFFAGLGVSALIGSSTSIAVLSVQTVAGGQAVARRMLAFLIGADVGLTTLVLLSSTSLDRYAGVPILLGVIGYQFMSSTRARGAGQVLLSIGFVFMGIGVIRAAATAITPNSDLLTLIQVADHYPPLMAFLAAVLAVILQSSTATILLVIGIGGTGAISIPSALAAVAGANLGTGLTMLMIGLPTAESRRMALGNLLAKLITASVVLAALPLASVWVARIPMPFDQQIALSHTGFNLLLAVLALPLIPVLDKVASYLVPAPKPGDAPVFGPRYITEPARVSMSVALGQSMREILHVSEIVRTMLDDLWTAIIHDDAALVRELAERDDRVDTLDALIKRYLVRLAGQTGEDDPTGEHMRQLRFLSELETIGDTIDKNLSELASKKIRNKIAFNDESWRELDGFYQLVRENLLIAETAFHSRDQNLAKQLLRHKQYIDQLHRDLRDQHLARLNDERPDSFEASSVYLDLLTHLRRINSCLTHIAYAVLDIKNDETLDAVDSAKVAAKVAAVRDGTPKAAAKRKATPRAKPGNGTSAGQSNPSEAKPA
jgi:phosphate:Na+ symporter